jgi:hypothetical protein
VNVSSFGVFIDGPRPLISSGKTQTISHETDQRTVPASFLHRFTSGGLARVRKLLQQAASEAVFFALSQAFFLHGDDDGIVCRRVSLPLK